MMFRGKNQRHPARFTKPRDEFKSFVVAVFSDIR
jgi:hypothetical protein